MAKLRETPSQTAGPFVHIGTLPALAGLETQQKPLHVLAGSDTLGRRIRIEGQIWDGAGALVKDAVVEIWQADANGEYQDQYHHENAFNSFGRTATTFDAGEWTLHTVKPGVVNNAAGVPMAPHINLSLFARGINIHLHTRLYFDDEAQANAQCPVLNLIEQPQRRETLIARRCEVDGKTAYRFDIRIQGEGETVFFDF